MGHAALGTYRSGYGYHTGIDFLGPLGLKVVAMADGVVVSSTPTASRWGYGHNVVIYHAQLGLSTRYSHLYARDVKEGQRVTAGQQIGRMGTSGTDNVHLHFDVIKVALPNPRFNPHNPATGGVTRPLAGLDPVEDALTRKYFSDPLAFLNGRSALNPTTQKVVHA
nr:M23 family metallopeptidase [Deinococcus xianganensis]